MERNIDYSASSPALSRGRFAYRACVLHLQPLLDAVGVEVVPALQNSQEIIVFVLLLP